MKRATQILFAMVVLSIFSSVSANINNNGYIEAEGVIYFEEGMSPNQMRRMSVLDAYRYLAEQTDTLYISSESTVRNARDLDDVVNEKVDAALRGAEVISVIRESDGSFHATVRLPIYGGSRSLAAAVLKKDIRTEDFSKPRFVNIRTELQYTGLVVDCRGLNLLPAITPKIKSVGGVEVYAYKNLGYQNAVDKGIVEYSSSPDSSRAGNLPLVVKAVKISDSCDVVVSDEDADRILAANQSANILGKCAVVLVR